MVPCQRHYGITPSWLTPRMAELQTYRWDDMPRESLKEGLGRRLISGDRVMLTHVYFAAGTEVPQHRHDNEQITYILEGALQSSSARTARSRARSAPARSS